MTLLLANAAVAQCRQYDFSAVSPSGKEYYYIVENGGAVVVNKAYPCWMSWVNSNEDIFIPDSVEYMGVKLAVTKIATNAFSDHLGSISIPATVKEIGGNAFGDMQQFNFRGSIADWCTITFDDASANPMYYTHCIYINGEKINNIAIPEGVTEIKPYAFYGGSGIKSITLPNTLLQIGEAAFCNCYSVQPITIPNTVTSIASSSFVDVPMIFYNDTLSGAPWGARYMNGFIEDSLYYTNSTKDTIVGCMSSKKNIVIPNTVTTIANNAFYYYDELESVIIPSSVTKIGSGAFYNCTSLRPLIIPNSVINIAFYALYNVPMVYYYGTAHGASWGARTLNGYEEGGLYYTSNAKDSLVYCSPDKSSITIPGTVTYIDEMAFANAHMLDTVHLNTWMFAGFINNKYYLDSISVLYIDSILFWPSALIEENNHLKSIFLTGTQTVIPNNALKNCTRLESVVIGNSVTAIGTRAFSNCNSLKSVEMGNSVTTIGEYAFSNCYSLDSIAIPDGVDSINSNTFYNDTSLVSIELPSSLRMIGSFAFDNCSSLASVDIPNSVTSIGSMAFRNCSSLASVEIPNSVTSIGISTFYNCSSLTSVLIPDSVTSIGSYAFYNCSSLTSITIPNLVTSIDSKTFYNCSNLKSLTLGQNIKSIYNDAFNNTTIDTLYYNIDSIGAIHWSSNNPRWDSVRVVYIGDNVQYWPESLFYGCAKLGKVTIGNSVTAIGNGAFYNCSNLRNISLGRSLKTMGANAFTNTAIDTVYYNIDSIGNFSWNNRPMWDSIHVAYIGNDVHYWPDHLFRGCTNLESVYIGDSVTNIGSYAFYNCGNLTSVNIPNGVTTIGGYAFYHCSNITSVNIPDLVTSIGWAAFAGCSSLDTVSIGNSVTAIEGSVFSGCNSLVSVYIPNSVTSIGWEAFSSCGSLSSLTIPNSVVSIGDYAFSGCSSLTSVVIPNSVTSVGQSTFKNCCNLTAVTMPNLMNSIGSCAFEGCSSLTQIKVPDGVATIGYGMFKNCRNLKSLTIGRNVNEFHYLALDSCISLDTLYFNADSLPDFEAGSAWETRTPFFDSVRVIIMGDSVRYIPDYMLRFKSRVYGNSGVVPLRRLEYLKIGGKVRNIRNGLCQDMASLKTVVLPDGLITIGNNSFKDCDVKYINIPESVTTIGDWAFRGCQWDSLYIGASVRHIGEYAFSYSNYYYSPTKIIFDADSLEECSNTIFCSHIDSVVVGNSSRFIPAHIFQNKHLLYLTLGESVEQIGTAAFAYNSFPFSIPQLPASLRSIGDSAFYNTNNTGNLVLPDSLLSIGDKAFGQVYIYDTIFFPLSLQTIGTGAFKYFPKVVAPWEQPIDIQGAFDYIGQGYASTAIVPCYAVMNYMSDSVWCIVNINGYGDGAVPVREDIVACSPLTWRDSITYSDGDSASLLTVYEDRCDTIYTMHLRIQDPRYALDTHYVCDNMWPYEYSIPTSSYTPTFWAWSPGYQELTMEDVYGCDSIVGVELIEVPTFLQEDTILLCESVFPYYYQPQDTVIERQAISNSTYGLLEFKYIAGYGCDSVYKLNINVRESPEAEICMITVDGARNKLIWNRQQDVKQYNIYREGLNTGMYDLVSVVPSDEMTEWVDSNSNPMSHSYRYRISNVDSCDVESEMSEVHKTMHLTINRGVGNDWNLVWTEYEGAVYSSYQIYRGSNPTDMELIDQMAAGGNTTYTDHDVNLPIVYYQIAIIKDEPCFSTKNATVIRSNIATNGTLEIPATENGMIDVGVYPNPAIGSVFLSCSEKIAEVKMMDVTGRIMTTITPNNNTAQILLNEYPTGTYMLRITTQSGINLRRLVVE